MIIDHSSERIVFPWRLLFIVIISSCILIYRILSIFVHRGHGWRKQMDRYLILDFLYFRMRWNERTDGMVMIPRIDSCLCAFMIW